jgi:hypothetical protein
MLSGFLAPHPWHTLGTERIPAGTREPKTPRGLVGKRATACAQGVVDRAVALPVSRKSLVG